MAAALFAGHQRFARDVDGKWRLRGASIETFVPHAAIDLRKHAYVVVDVESTGTRAYHGDRITEVAAVLVQGGKATMVFDTLVNPERPIPPAITALTNISAEMVRDAPRFAEVCEQLLGVLEGRVFVAHNAAFDWRFISMEVERATGRRLEGVSLCTVRLTRRFAPEIRRRNLDAVAAYYGIEIGARHRAGGDAMATAHVLMRLLKAARGRGCSTLDDVERILAQRTSKRRRRRPPALPYSASDDSWA
jgi:DNA polymerase-3 subunit epsilon